MKEPPSGQDAEQKHPNSGIRDEQRNSNAYQDDDPTNDRISKHTPIKETNTQEIFDADLSWETPTY